MEALCVVSMEEPHLIVASDPNLCRLLCCTSEMIVGNSINLLYGPETDSSILSQMIKNVAIVITISAQVVLYDAHGQCNQMMVCADVIQSSAGLSSCCALTISPSEAVPLDNIVRSNNAYAIISAQPPYTLFCNNDSFRSIFSLPGLVPWPPHAAPTSNLSPSEWSAILLFASRGRPTDTAILARLPNGEFGPLRLRCVPIATDNALVTLLGIVLSPLATTSGLDSEEPSQCAASDAARDAIEGAISTEWPYCGVPMDFMAGAVQPPPAAAALRDMNYVRRLRRRLATTDLRLGRAASAGSGPEIAPLN